MISFTPFSIQLPNLYLFFTNAGGYWACFELTIVSITIGMRHGALLSFSYSPARGLYVGSLLFMPAGIHLRRANKAEEE